jgi:hypothetical protein
MMEELLQKIFKETINYDVKLPLRQIKYEDAVKSNGGFFTTFEIPAVRNDFFGGLGSATDLKKYIRRFVKTKSLVREVYERLHSVLASIKRRILS